LISRHPNRSDTRKCTPARLSGVHTPMTVPPYDQPHHSDRSPPRTRSNPAPKRCSAGSLAGRTAKALSDPLSGAPCARTRPAPRPTPQQLPARPNGEDDHGPGKRGNR
jgi:hypothetical protein